MRKTLIGPQASDVDAPDIETTASSLGVVVHHDGYREVSLSGIVWPEAETVTEQTEVILGYLESLFEEALDASLADVTAIRFYVDSGVLSPATRSALHEVRHEFFDPEHFPASTMVAVTDDVPPDALVEIEVEATIPDDGWTVDVLEIPDE